MLARLILNDPHLKVEPGSLWRGRPGR